MTRHSTKSQLDMGPLAEFCDEFPPLIARNNVAVVTGGIIQPKTIMNDESMGYGPKRSLMVAGKRVYPRESLLEYLHRKGVSEIHVEDLASQYSRKRKAKKAQ